MVGEIRTVVAMVWGRGRFPGKGPERTFWDDRNILCLVLGGRDTDSRQLSKPNQLHTYDLRTWSCVNTDLSKKERNYELSIL